MHKSTSLAKGADRACTNLIPEKFDIKGQTLHAQICLYIADIALGVMKSTDAKSNENQNKLLTQFVVNL
jgi:hypothetical protein